MRLKSSSIYYALFLSVIISLFLGGMILFAGMNKQFDSQMRMQNDLISNATSGIEYGLANTNEMENGRVLKLDLFGNGYDSVEIAREQWGGYEVIKSSAHHKKLKYSKAVFAGSSVEDNIYNLFISDLGKPIAICGNTRLEGKCALPKAGIDRAHIMGRHYEGKQDVYGIINNSQRELPAYNQSLVNMIDKLPGEIRTWENEDSIFRSFHDSPIHFIDDNIVSLEHHKLSGHIILEAKDSIFVSKDAHLDGIILKSKVIYIENGFKGKLQCYVSESITIEEQAILEYPSAIGLVESTFQEERSAQISIKKGAQVLGTVFAISEKPNFRYPIQISIEEEAAVNGLVYCTGKTELRGTVNGSLYTYKTYLHTKSSKYENHFLDAKVLDKLPDEFVFVPFLRMIIL